MHADAHQQHEVFHSAVVGGCGDMTCLEPQRTRTQIPERQAYQRELLLAEVVSSSLASDDEKAPEVRKLVELFPKNTRRDQSQVGTFGDCSELPKRASKLHSGWHACIKGGQACSINCINGSFQSSGIHLKNQCNQFKVPCSLRKHESGVIRCM